MRVPPPASGPAGPEPSDTPLEGDEDSELDPAPRSGARHRAHAQHAGEAAVHRAREDEERARRRVEEREGGRGRKERERTVALDQDRLERSPRSLVPQRAPDDGPRAQPGDLSLTDPAAARRALETPVAYATHAMILAEAFRRATGATRAEAIAYLARLFFATGDANFGRAAMKELGPATGIVDLYPLELLDHVLEVLPSFLPKVARGRFFAREGEVLVMDTDRPTELRYREELKVRGFALVGGGRPGYRFEPAAPGVYRLSIHTPGRYTLATSCLSKTGQMVLDRLEVSVRAGARALPRVPADDDVPPRDAEKVAAWPVPEVELGALVDALHATEPLRRELCSRFTADELAQRIGVLGLQNLRARLSALRAGVVHEETQPSWSAPRGIEIEDEPEVEEALPVARPRARPRAPARKVAEDRSVAPALAREALAREGVFAGIAKAGPVVARPRVLGDDEDFEGEEPTATAGVGLEEPTGRIVVEADPTKPLDRDAVAAAIDPAERPGSETRPIPVKRPPSRRKGGFAEVKPTDRTQRLKVKEERDEGDEGTLTELED